MKGVLLVNLGSPKSTSTKDVRTYLDEFLMDKRVIDMPYWKRFLLIKGVILRTRPKKAAQAYKKIWTQEGSPLIVISEKFTKKVASKCSIPIALAMRYGRMSIKNGYKQLVDQGVTEVLLIPLYPHYAMSSFETVVEKAKEVNLKWFSKIHTSVLPAFYNNPAYINAMSNTIKKQLKDDVYDHVLFSYHGIPERHIHKSDITQKHCKIDGSCCNKASKAHATCYRHQCFETTKGIVKQLQLKEGSYSNSFQSRLLKDPWLKPYTDFELKKFPKQGKKKIAVIAPSFVTDCLETLEELKIRGKEDFIKAGGHTFTYVSCMNTNKDWVETVVDWIEKWNLKKNN